MAKNNSAKKAAKAIKRKNKPKLDAKTRRVRHIHTAVTDVYNRLYFTGSSVTKGVKCHNLASLSALLKDKDFTVGEHIINDKLRTDDVVWRFWIGVFSDDGDEIWCDPLLIDSEPCTVRDFDAFISPLIKQHIIKINEQQEAEFGTTYTKGYGWAGTPNDTCDLDASEENFVAWFINRDVCNEEKRKAIIAGEEVEEISVANTIFGGREEILIEGERRYTKLKRTLGIGKIKEVDESAKTTAEIKALMAKVA